VLEAGGGGPCENFDPLLPGYEEASIFFPAELVERVVLLGGSSLSPWAIQREPLAVKRRVAELLGCPGDLEADDVAPCLRLRNVEDLLEVKLDVPRFTSGYAPFVDGAILPAALVNTQVRRLVHTCRLGKFPGRPYRPRLAASRPNDVALANDNSFATSFRYSNDRL
jgi:hypothetical protein